MILIGHMTYCEHKFKGLFEYMGGSPSWSHHFAMLDLV